MLTALLVVLVIIGLWFAGGGVVNRVSDTESPAVTVAEVADLVTDVVPGAVSATTTKTLQPTDEKSVVVEEPFSTMRIGATLVSVSVADTLAERIAGLSGTSALPADTVKLFVFESEGPQPIWMKDMRYAIDIMWVDSTGLVVHTETAVSPDTFPQSFASPVPARYVIEAESGFLAKHNVTVGTPVTLPGRTTN